MTEQQFEKGIDLFNQIRALKFAIQEFEKKEGQRIVRLDISTPYFIDDVIQKDIKNIENEYASKIVNEALDVLRLHVIRLQSDLDQI